MKQAVYIVSTDSPMPSVFAASEAKGLVRQVRQDRLTDAEIRNAAGLIAGVGLDQIDMLERNPAIEAMLDAGGRLVVSGHVLRPYVKGLAPFVPLLNPRRPDYALTRLSEHPVLAGIEARTLEANRGVAGFYGRGHNPPPEGAVAITGLGPGMAPVDWVWHRPAGGAVFMHAGNDLWGVGDDPAARKLIAERLVQWCLEGQVGEKAA